MEWQNFVVCIGPHSYRFFTVRLSVVTPFSGIRHLVDEPDDGPTLLQTSYLQHNLPLNGKDIFAGAPTHPSTELDHACGVAPMHRELGTGGRARLKRRHVINCSAEVASSIAV